MKKAAIYLRRSKFDDKSLSIEGQLAECRAKLKEGEEYEVYCDNGISGKDTEHRPEFMRMVEDVHNGVISTVIVKKYDRFARNLQDFTRVVNDFEAHGANLISIQEDFDTSTPAGRTMRSMMAVFAEFERETIAGRIKDNYAYKAHETGFFQGGKGYFGFSAERRVVDGRSGMVLFPNGNAVDVKRAFEIYAEKDTSYRTAYNEIDALRENKKSSISDLRNMLRNPLYVKADSEVYKYLAGKGVKMYDDISAYDGNHGVFLHGKRSETPFAKVGYHEGIVDSALWLAVQDKLDGHNKVRQNHEAVNSWLVGLTKCAYCGYCIIWHENTIKSGKSYLYLVDGGWTKPNRCVKRTLTMRPAELEDEVFAEMQKRVKQLEIAKKKRTKPNTAAEKAKAEIVRIDEEINGLIDKLPKANDILVEQINKRVTELTKRKGELSRELLARERKEHDVDTAPLLEPLNRWNELSMQEKHDVAATMIEVIYVSDENGVDIRFSI
ncbi:MAG: recombinase family protein [Lachnospiraceae bacterium]|nr:recombinase family protein [Ruminococcus sp.]MCM1275760.1 recombinase family protein [Lachnospiraceae bacterium]